MTTPNSPSGKDGNESPYRVAIVGSGPSGFYAAEALLNNKELAVDVDVFDRLPAPFGLVRYGVAPDHQKMKNVIKAYYRTALRPDFRFRGNVNIGKDITVDDLRKHYHAIIYAFGCETDRQLGIPGEDLEGSHTATSFVGWYNSHPDHRHREFELSSSRMVVVGVGNVAMDITRIMLKDRNELGKTDIADFALAALCESNVREVVLLGRRGPAQAAFTPGELKELGEMADTELVVDPADMELDEDSQTTLQTDVNARKNVEFLRVHAKAQSNAPQRVVFRFLTSPVEILGDNGKVTGVKIEKNELVKDPKSGRIRSQGTGKFELLETGLVFRSIGYHGVPMPGVPFDARAGIIPNKDGRVIDPSTESAVNNEYVVGWIKRGPSGLIGTNKGDSVATVRSLLADLANQPPASDPARTRAGIDALFKARKLRTVNFDDWETLNVLEREAGEPKGKIREKFKSPEEMLAALKK